MRMIVKQLSVGTMQNWSYIIVCDDTKEAAIVDPAWDAGKLENELDSADASLKYLLCTHGHADHINASSELLKNYPESKIITHESEGISAPDGRFELITDGDTLSLGSLSIKCVHTPGHTPGGLSYFIENYGFFGDTLFCDEDCGRVDFYSNGAEDLFNSLSKINKMDDSIIVCSGHKYGSQDQTTLEYEKKNNKALLCKTFEEFKSLKGL